MSSMSRCVRSPGVAVCWSSASPAAASRRHPQTASCSRVARWWASSPAPSSCERTGSIETTSKYSTAGTTKVSYAFTSRARCPWSWHTRPWKDYAIARSSANGCSAPGAERLEWLFGPSLDAPSPQPELGRGISSESSGRARSKAAAGSVLRTCSSQKTPSYGSLFPRVPRKSTSPSPS